jgi:hypothetical protein
MEEIAAALATMFGEACCELVVAIGIDALTGVAGYKSHKSHKGTLPERTNWTYAFWILLPIALVVTVISVYSLVRR